MFTKLDSSGEARLSNSTLTFTSKGPEKHTMRARLNVSIPKTYLKRKNNTDGPGLPLRIGCRLAAGSTTRTSWGVIIPQQKS